MKNQFTRRRFLVTAGAAATTIAGSSIFNLDTVWAAPYTRRNLGGMSASDPVLVSYRKAIKAMKMLPSSNPLSWDYQAAIHGTTLPGSYTAWNTCEHGTQWFWSWHRMYLYWFERIIRKMSGDSSFALPYWDYTSSSQRSLPGPFRDSTSELFFSNRGTGWNAGTSSYAAWQVDPSAGNADTDFFTGQSDLESNPHDNVHVYMGGAMGNPSTAAADPVFYVHHSNIDRLWNLWLAQGGGRFDPMSTSSWVDQSYTFFDENGKQLVMKTCDILRAAEQLNYTYEGEPPQVKAYCLRIFPPIIYLILEVLFHWPGPPVELGPEDVAVPIVNLKEFQQRLAPIAASQTETLFLELDNVVADRYPGAGWEVYLGLPANSPPNPESPFFVGTMTLFAAGVRAHAHGEFKPAHFRFRANRAVLEALRTNQEQLRLVFVPTGPLMEGKRTRGKVESPVHIGTINLSVGKPGRGKEGVVPGRPQVEPRVRPEIERPK